MCRSVHWLSSPELYFDNSVLATWLGLLMCEVKHVCSQQHTLVIKKNKLYFLFWCWIPTKAVKCQRWEQNYLFHFDSLLLFKAMVKWGRLGYVQVVNEPNHPQVEELWVVKGVKRKIVEKHYSSDQQMVFSFAQLWLDLHFCILLCPVIFKRNENMQLHCIATSEIPRLLHLLHQ